MEQVAEERTVRVSSLELFFDLVFVFTLTQLTGLLANDPTWTGLTKVVLLLSLIWWIYDGYVWLTNTVALDVLGHRLLLLGGMGGFLLMALAIPTTFERPGISCGTLQDVVVPRPRRPLDPLPQAYTSPVAVNARLWLPPAATLTAAGMPAIETGRDFVAVVPSPT